MTRLALAQMQSEVTAQAELLDHVGELMVLTGDVGGFLSFGFPDEGCEDAIGLLDFQCVSEEGFLLNIFRSA